MDAIEFELLVNNRLFLTEKVLGQKADEYVLAEDRLSNFKRAAALQQCTPEKSLLGFVTKHIVALYDFVDKLEAGQVEDLLRWNEKLGDIINYMILLEGLVIERHQKNETSNT